MMRQNLGTSLLSLSLLLTCSFSLTACGVGDELGAPSQGDDFEDDESGRNTPTTERPEVYLVDRSNPEPMGKFDSKASYDTYMGELLREYNSKQAIYDWESQNNTYTNNASGNNMASADMGAADAPSEPGNESITNNQEEGVDEGGIVKNVGDYLVVLRQGRLYTVSVEAGQPIAQTDDMRVAPDESLNNDVWYDEMLVKGDQIYVIGYRYSLDLTGGSGASSGYGDYSGATEVSSFGIDATTGKLTRGETMFLESNDYFSGSNYASRMVDGKLVFYMPYNAISHNYSTGRAQLRTPSVYEYASDGSTRVLGPMFKWSEVTHSFTPPSSPTFHTLVTCDLPDSLEMSCSARTLLADWAQAFYVSSQDVYIKGDEHVFAFPLDGSEPVAHAAHGYPSDQFAFKATEEKLYLAVMDYTGAGGVEMLALERAAFDHVGQQTVQSNPLGLDVSSWWTKQRHIGAHHLIASMEYDYRSNTSTSRLNVHERVTGVNVEIPIDGEVTRIESLGHLGAFVGVQRQDELVLQRVILDGTPRLGGELVLADVREGESRSHGFFFRSDATGGGMFGLSVTNPYGFGSNDYYWWGTGISNLAIFDIDALGNMDTVGTVSSSPDAEGECETSCVDWYGNTRPIFLRERMLALMGSELVEVAIDADDMFIELSRELLEITGQ